MPKRLTATEKWLDPWFCGLSNENKLFWIFLLDNCDHAGFWQVNIPLTKFYFGTTFEIDMPTFDSRIVFLSNVKWFIPKFIAFQYSVLDQSNRAHNSVIQKLKKEGLYKGLTSPLIGDKDKDKDKDKDNVVRGGVGGFDGFWNAYPKKVARKKAEDWWIRTKPNTVLVGKIIKAIESQKKSDQWSRGFIPNPISWLNQERWDDDVNSLKGGMNGNVGKVGVGRIVGAAAPVPGKYDKIDGG